LSSIGHSTHRVDGRESIEVRASAARVLRRMRDTMNKMILRCVVLASALVAGASHSAPIVFTFQANVGGKSGGLPDGCDPAAPVFATCGEAPPRGFPLTITTSLDEYGPPVVSSGPTALETTYVMRGASYIDFGYRSEFRFTDFYVRVVDDDIRNSAPDRLYIIRDERPVYGGVPEA